MSIWTWPSRTSTRKLRSEYSSGRRRCAIPVFTLKRAPCQGHCTSSPLPNRRCSAVGPRESTCLQCKTAGLRRDRARERGRLPQRERSSPDLRSARGLAGRKFGIQPPPKRFSGAWVSPTTDVVLLMRVGSWVLGGRRGSCAPPARLARTTRRPASGACTAGRQVALHLVHDARRRSVSKSPRALASSASTARVAAWSPLLPTSKPWKPTPPLVENSYVRRAVGSLEGAGGPACS